MYSVHWVESALGDVLHFWMAANSAERRAITASIHRIDKELASNPEDAGESRPNGARILCELPIVATFEIHLRLRLVRVLGARCVSKSR